MAQIKHRWLENSKIDSLLYPICVHLRNRRFLPFLTVTSNEADIARLPALGQKSGSFQERNEI